jgi:hypothetical protein
MKQEHYDKLIKGVKSWNEWREENPHIGIRLFGVKLQEANLRWANLQRADLGEANLQGAELREVNLQGAQFGGANLQGAELEGANLQYADLRRANLNKASVPRVKYNKKAKYIGIRIASCYGNPGFKRFVQDQEYIEMLQKSRPFLYRIWLLSSDCGRSIVLWLFWSILLAISFGFNFFFMGSEHFAVKEPLPFDWITMLYYSVVTFTTLGFGDITPKTHIGALLVMLEVVIGYIMLGGLIYILATKLARRA